MRLNAQKHIHTHEGAKAKHINPEQALKRSLLSCFLWEKEFYEGGESIAGRIHSLADQCSPEFISSLAIEARLSFKLRHAPLWLSLENPRDRGAWWAAISGVAQSWTRLKQRSSSSSSRLQLCPWGQGALMPLTHHHHSTSTLWARVSFFSQHLRSLEKNIPSIWAPCQQLVKTALLTAFYPVI